MLPNLLAILAILSQRISISAVGIDPFPVPYASSFQEPAPPIIPAEFTANYMQVLLFLYFAVTVKLIYLIPAKIRTGINHIVAGFVSIISILFSLELHLIHSNDRPFSLHRKTKSE